MYTDMASIITAESCHVIGFVSIRESFIVTVVACFGEKKFRSKQQQSE